MTANTGAVTSPEPDTDVEAVMAAAKVIVALTARSMAGAPVTLPQLRVLAFLAERGTATLGAVATVLRVHPSNATRTCDRLVEAGLVDRRDSPADRRRLSLGLTAAGRALVDGVFAERRAAVARVLAALPAGRRREVAAAMADFATAGERLDGVAANDHPAGGWLDPFTGPSGM
jgi:DNA-binding MarR family transcriptional regulator